MAACVTSLAYRPEIDGLRAIAVVAVVLYHLDGSLMPGGFAGVDVFFVLSGYLITSLLAAEWRSSGRIDLGDFYARRVRRLMPALWLVITSVMVGSVFLLGPLGPAFHATLDSAMASLVFVANYYFLATAGGYFAGPSDQLPLLHLWSLAVEEQFYLVFPLLLWLLMARAPRHAWRILAAISLVSLGLAEHWMQFVPASAFFQMPARFWELGTGALVALSATSLPASVKLSRVLAALGLAVVLAALVVSGWHRHFPAAGALPAVLGTALVLKLVHDRLDLGMVGAWLASRPMVALGLWSYSLYLWHWPLLALDRAFRLEPSPLAWRGLLCLLALVLAALTYRYVEQPARRWRRWSSRRILLGGLFASTLVFALGTAFGQLDLVPPERRALVERSRADHPKDMAECHFSLGSVVDAATPRTCYPQADARRRVAIWGDSHALAWRPFADEMAGARGQRTQAMTMDSCPPLAGPSRPHARSPGHRAQCDARNSLALESLSAPGAFDIVILGSLWPALLDSDGNAADLAAQLDATLDQLDGVVPEVVLIASVPHLWHPAYRCIAADRLEDCAVPRARFEASAAPVRQAMREAMLAHPNLTVVDPTGFFCNDTNCPVMRDGYALFWDDDHVSSTAARAFAREYLADPARYTLTPATPAEH